MVVFWESTRNRAVVLRLGQRQVERVFIVVGNSFDRQTVAAVVLLLNDRHDFDDVACLEVFVVAQVDVLIVVLVA